eukprot:s2021_g1.t1
MVKHFTKENLAWSSLAKYPDCSFKGSDTRLLLGFLIDFIQHDNAQDVNSICRDALDAAQSMDDSIRMFYTEDRTFLPRAQGLVAFNLLEMWHVKSRVQFVGDVACQIACLCPEML